VQPARDLVAAAAELPAGVQLGHDHLERRQPGVRHLVDGDAASAVAHGDRVVGVDRDLDQVVVARERLVDRVRDDLLHEVVEAARAGRADVHPGAQADRLESFEHGDVLGRVAGLSLGLRHNQEMPAKRGFCEARKVYQIGVSSRPRTKPKDTAFSTLSRSF
jgi:hypothetical protein